MEAIVGKPTVKFFNRGFFLTLLVLLFSYAIWLGGILFYEGTYPKVYNGILFDLWTFLYGFCIWLCMYSFWGIPMLLALQIYKKKTGGNMHFWRSFWIALIVFELESLLILSTLIIMRYFTDGILPSWNYYLFITCFLICSGVASSLTAALLFKKPTVALTILALSIIFVLVGRFAHWW